MTCRGAEGKLIGAYRARQCRGGGSADAGRLADAGPSFGTSAGGVQVGRSQGDKKWSPFEPRSRGRVSDVTRHWHSAVPFGELARGRPGVIWGFFKQGGGEGDDGIPLQLFFSLRCCCRPFFYVPKAAGYRGTEGETKTPRRIRTGGKTRPLDPDRPSSRGETASSEFPRTVTHAGHSAMGDRPPSRAKVRSREAGTPLSLPRNPSSWRKTWRGGPNHAGSEFRGICVPRASAVAGMVPVLVRDFPFGRAHPSAGGQSPPGNSNPHDIGLDSRLVCGRLTWTGRRAG